MQFFCCNGPVTRKPVVRRKKEVAGLVISVKTTSCQDCGRDFSFLEMLKKDRQPAGVKTQA